jgi:hypothetical protein
MPMSSGANLHNVFDEFIYSPWPAAGGGRLIPRQARLSSDKPAWLRACPQKIEIGVNRTKLHVFFHDDPQGVFWKASIAHERQKNIL